MEADFLYLSIFGNLPVYDNLVSAINFTKMEILFYYIEIFYEKERKTKQNHLLTFHARKIICNLYLTEKKN